MYPDSKKTVACKPETQMGCVNFSKSKACQCSGSACFWASRIRTPIPLVGGMDRNPALDSDPSIIKQN